MWRRKKKVSLGWHKNRHEIAYDGVVCATTIESLCWGGWYEERGRDDELLTCDDLSPYAGSPNFLASFFLEFGSEIVALVPQHFPLFSFLETWLKYWGNLSRECRELSRTIMPCIKRLEQCVAKSPNVASVSRSIWSIFGGHLISEALRAMETTVIELVRAVQNDFDPPLFSWEGEIANTMMKERMGKQERNWLSTPSSRTQTVGRIQTIIGIIAEEMREWGAFRNSNFKTFPRARECACAVWKVGGWGRNKWTGKQTGW